MMEISAVCEKEEVKNAVRKAFPEVHVYETVFPHVFRAGSEDILREALKADEVVARTIDGLGFLIDNSYKGKIIGDAYLYTMNSASSAALKNMGLWRDTAPLELTFGELKDRGVSESELTVYGRVPLMVSAQCVYRNTHDDLCEKNGLKGHTVCLKDRTKRELPCLCYCRYCYNVIYNSVQLSLHNMMREVFSLKPAALRLAFTTEDEKTACRITEYYLELVKNGETGREFPLKEYTTGHFRKGVE